MAGSGRTPRRRMRLLAPLVLLIPVITLLAASFVPVVNQPALWLGFPPLVVVSSLAVLALTPCFLLVEWAWYGSLRRQRRDEIHGS